MNACTGACAFLRIICMHLDRSFASERHACVGVYTEQVLWHQRTHLRTRSLQGVFMRSFMCSLFIQRWGTKVGWFSQSMRALVAWRRGLFLTGGEIGVLSVSSLFLTRVGMYVVVCVSKCTHAHALSIWNTRLWTQGSGWDTWRARRIQMD